MNSEEYVQQRLDGQINWYDRKSQRNQTWHKRFRIVEFVAAALIPFLAGHTDRTGAWLSLTIGGLGVLVAVIAAILGLYQFEEHWIKYRTTCESLRKEKYLFLTGTEPYSENATDSLALLVQRAETLISSENTNWAQYMARPAEEPHRG